MSDVVKHSLYLLLFGFVIRGCVRSDFCSHYPIIVWPSGYLKCDFIARPPRANATVRVPTLPMNIEMEIMIFPAGDSIGVRPVLSPTVPIALTCSKTRSKNVKEPLERSSASLEKGSQLLLLKSFLEENSP